MSAFVVSKRHIDVMVQSALAGCTDRERGGSDNDKFRFYHGVTWFTLDRYADEQDPRTLSPSQFGQLLVSECVASVSYRYPDDNVDAGELPGPCDAYYTAPYVFEPATDPNVMVIGAAGLRTHVGALVSLAELAKAISCYDYQSCEHPGWKTSAAHTICEALNAWIVRSLPGYDAAPWGWD